MFFDVVNDENFYNLVYGGGTSRGWKPSEETRKKKSESAIKRFESEEARRQASESHKGYCPTEETRRKMSESLKGKMAGDKNPNFGKPMPEHVKQKLIESHLGKKFSEERKQKMREARLGFTHTEETKEKIREKAKNRLSNPENHPFYGKHHSDETKDKIRNSLKGKMSGDKNPNYGNHSLAGENHPMWGKHHTEETKQKLREAHIGRHAGEKNHFYGKTHSEETREKLRKARLGSKMPEETKKKLKNQIKTPVRNIEYNTYYKGYVEAEEVTGISRNSIKSCCHGYGGQKTAGRDPFTGEKLHWEHCTIEEYMKHKDEPNEFYDKRKEE